MGEPTRSDPDSSGRRSPRIWLIGSSGSGKTTLGKRLSQIYEIPYIELDSIYHQANWQPLPDEELTARVKKVVAEDGWIIDGNYKKVSSLIKSRCTMVIFLNFPRRKIVFRIIRRSLGRIFTRQKLWNGNKESFGSILSFRPQRNVLLWALLRFKERRREYLHPDFLKNHPNTKLLVLHNQKEVEKYFRFLSKGV